MDGARRTTRWLGVGFVDLVRLCWALYILIYTEDLSDSELRMLETHSCAQSLARGFLLQFKPEVCWTIAHSYENAFAKALHA